MVKSAAPTTLSEDQALSLIESAIKQSRAEGVSVSLSAGESSLSRYSENQISQNISSSRLTLTVTSSFGTRSAKASTTELEPEAVAATILRSEELARIAPEDPEWVPLLEPQEYDRRTPAFDDATAQFPPLARGEIVQRVCAKSATAKASGAGTLSTQAELQATGNSRGLRACNQTTKADFSFTARMEDGSAWGRRTAWAVRHLPVDELAEQIIERAAASRHPREISPGTYPTVFNSAAFAELLAWVMWNLDARAADEGRSFMSRTDSAGSPTGNRAGEQIFSPLVTVRREPAHPELQTGTFFSDGLPNTSLDMIAAGTPQTLLYSRYWAQKQGKQPTGSNSPTVMEGSNQSLSDVIAQTERGILVNRTWYVRYVNPRTLEVTGMTRDGTFWIQDGKIAHPIKNLRFNQSLPDMLRDIDALSTAHRYGDSLVPGVRVRAFNFSSITDSV